MQSILDVFSGFFTLFGPGVGLVAGIAVVTYIIYILFPNRVKKACTYVWRSFRTFSSWCEYLFVAHDIEAKVNSFAAYLSTQAADVDPVTVKVRFVKHGELPDDFMRSGDLIIRMRRSDAQDDNLVRAAEVYVRRMLLPDIRTRLSDTQASALDLFVTERLLAEADPHARTRYYSEVVTPAAARHSGVAQLLRQFDSIDFAGLFYPVMLQELSFSGTGPIGPSEMPVFRNEVNRFTGYLTSASQREQGDDSTPLDFSGQFFRCCITIIGKRAKAETGDVGPYLDWLDSLVTQYDTVYLISPSRHKAIYVAVLESVGSRGLFDVYFRSSLVTRIRAGSTWRSRDAQLAVLRNRMRIPRLRPVAQSMLEVAPSARAAAQVQSWQAGEAGARLFVDEYEAAERIYGHMIDVEPRQASHYFGRARARIGAGDLEGAGSDAARFEELNPKDPSISTLREELASGRLSDKTRSWPWLLTVLNEAISTGDVDLSRKVYEKARSHKPFNPTFTALYECALHILAHDYHQAWKTLETIDAVYGNQVPVIHAVLAVACCPSEEASRYRNGLGRALADSRFSFRGSLVEALWAGLGHHDDRPLALESAVVAVRAAG